MKFTIFLQLKRPFLALLLPLGLLACAARPTASLPALPPPPDHSGEHYSLRVGDLLTITFSGETDLTQQARVDWNGKINVPPLAADGKATTSAVRCSAFRATDFTAHLPTGTVTWASS